MGLTYKESGVDIEKGDLFADIIKEKLRGSNNIGMFGGLYQLDANNILVAGTDGVGTKLILAREAKKYNTIGVDLVAMCVNDIITLGAKPLFFLDYMATSNLDTQEASAIIDGIIEGCRQADCALLGGETAEMPGVYKKGDYELAGFTVGMVAKDKLIDGKTIRKGDIIVGLKSSGIHSNGLSLARKALFKKYNYQTPFFDRTLIEELLVPTRIYAKLVLNVIKTVPVNGMAHITGGGLYNNIKRLLPEKLYPKIHWDKLTSHMIFGIIQEIGKIEDEEMRNTFNMGIGYIFIIDTNHLAALRDLLKENNEEAVVMGEINES